MPRRYFPWVLGLVVLAGCHSPVREEVDALVCTTANHPLDVQLFAPVATAKGAASLGQPAPNEETGLLLTSAEESAVQEQLPLPEGAETPPKINLLQRLTPPPGLPGAGAPQLEMPSRKVWEKMPAEKKDEVLRKYFPPLPPLTAEPPRTAGPGGQPLTLADLQKLAMANSPLLRQAASDIEAAHGAMVQAGAYPNPTVGYQASSHGPSGGPTVGGFGSQIIKTPGKLKYAQAAAQMDLENAQLAYRRAQTDLMASVRTGYYAVLVADATIRADRALVKLTDEVYLVLVQQQKGGEAALYEPMQIAVFAVQARASLVQARNSYTLSWKQLASSLGLPGMPPTEVAGSIEVPAPLYRYDEALAHVLANHTDVKTAENGIRRARYNLGLAEITPIPDLQVTGTVVNDLTPPGPFAVTVGVNVGVIIPVWDQNKGAIRQAQAALLRAVEEPHSKRDALTAALADAYRRWDENRVLLELYRTEVLPKQVQAFRAAVARYFRGDLGSVAYTDLVSSEQNLVSVIGAYLPLLASQWQAVVDVANFLQTDDIFQHADVAHGAAFDLEHLLTLPCCHPCNPLPDSRLRGADISWPHAGFVAGPEQGRKAPAGALPQEELLTPPPGVNLLPPISATSAVDTLPHLDSPDGAGPGAR